MYDGIDGELRATIERYNLVLQFLNTLPAKNRNLAAWLFLRALNTRSNDIYELEALIEEIKGLINFANENDTEKENEIPQSKPSNEEVFDYFLGGLDLDREFSKGFFPKLLETELGKTENDELNNLMDFIDSKIINFDRKIADKVANKG